MHAGRDVDDYSQKVPGEIDVQRARRILEELRRRLADPSRPQIELDYLERLLKDF
jgi:anti-anti-sigma regulatory factor